MNPSWNALGTSCSRLGRRHAHVLFIWNVPYVVPAAAMAPTNHDALKRDVIMGRSLAYASSPMSEEALTMAKGIPKPRTQREARNMSAFRAPACRPAPRDMIKEAKRMVRRRPRY